MERRNCRVLVTMDGDNNITGSKTQPFDAVILALIGAGTEDIDNKEHAIGVVMEDGTTYIDE
jgi:hypothetical protein